MNILVVPGHTVLFLGIGQECPQQGIDYVPGISWVFVLFFHFPNSLFSHTAQRTHRHMKASGCVCKELSSSCCELFNAPPELKFRSFSEALTHITFSLYIFPFSVAIQLAPGFHHYHQCPVWFDFLQGYFLTLIHGMTLEWLTLCTHL